MSFSETFATEAREKAGDYFREGYNCAESLFLCFKDLLNVEVDSSVIRILTVFGGGVGQAGCICGALTGAIVTLGLLIGRTNIEEKLDPIYKLSREFHTRFQNHFGTVCCRDMSPYPFGSRDRLRYCLKITGNTARLLAEYLMEKNLTKT